MQLFPHQMKLAPVFYIYQMSTRLAYNVLAENL